MEVDFYSLGVEINDTTKEILFIAVNMDDSCGVLSISIAAAI